MNKTKKAHTFGRIIKMLFKFYPALVPITILCILFSAAAAAIPDIFIQQITKVVADSLKNGTPWSAVEGQVWSQMTFLIVMYVIAIIITTLYAQLMAYITQGYLCKMRRAMFDGMQNLPIKYFDTHKHGDIMSYYTNDIDTLRQLISQALPALIRSGTIVLAVLGIMLWYSVWLTLIIVGGVVIMMFVSKKFGGGAAKYFIRQQKLWAAAEGYMQEMMNGQKVVKVFCHEKECQEEFDKINEDLCDGSTKANAYANMLGPIIMNIGNVLFVIVAVVGGLFLLLDVNNVSISGMALEISIVAAFLNMTRQFTSNVNQVSQQINAIVMAMAGAGRIFSLMDAQPEDDNGTVTLVNVADNNGALTETKEHTGRWAWKKTEAGKTELVPLKGDVRFLNVDFGYEPNKQVLHDITLYAKPGQKVAFVGATGAGKTTITNLINRYYDISNGNITYDGINVSEIKKSDLRRSLGIVLQDTNLFTGTVMENIRYGNLTATDEECIKAAKLAGADSFITRLPNGYDTELSNNGANLSQGQRQLIAIARAAVADPPVMILDEATSSIDTHTEAIVQRGMDKLMEGRTVFVIAHRLSTVMNSDVIMVLDHGNIIERGTHDQLIEQKGTYYQLYTGAFELE
ncbi:MAG: ABC transporter ATP-binding protein [Clostridiales bacterium]|nr:ABC transporter ATP-binding protein [Clostridiales bacterium]